MSETNSNSMIYVISREVVSGLKTKTEHPDGRVDYHPAPKAIGVYFGNPTQTEFNQTFGRYGIPDGWMVSVISAEDVKRYHNGEFVPSHVHELINAPIICKGLYEASWKDDFRQHFRLDKDFNPFG